MGKWYGSIENRLEENQNLNCEKIVGGLLTEFSYTDRRPYEIVKVDNQKHIYIRELAHRKADDEQYSNNWELYSDETNPIKELVYRNNSWKYVFKYTKDSIKNLVFIDQKLYDKIQEKGKAVQYVKANITFGYADYYYDYSF